MEPDDQHLAAALGDLAAMLGRLDLTLTVEGRAEALARRDTLRAAIEGWARRLEDPDAPLLVVVAGVTGAGKSTIVNTLADARAAATGVRRPTTSHPTLVAHPDDLASFRGDRVLADLRRSAGRAEQPRHDAAHAAELHLVGAAAVPPGLALLDAPDSDSVSDANRLLADALLDAADAWVWVTTQGKYADRESVAGLRHGRDRRAVVLAVLAQVDPEHAEEVRADYARRLADDTIEVPVVVVPRITPDGEQLPTYAVAGVSAWLDELTDGVRPRDVRRQTLRGAIAALDGEVAPLIEVAEAELRAATALGDAAAMVQDEAVETFADDLASGRLPLRREVLASWEAMVDSGPLRGLVERATSATRGVLDRLRGRSALLTAEQSADTVHAEARALVADRVEALAGAAARDLHERWMADPVGRAVLERHDPRLEPSDDLPERTSEEVAAWRAEVGDLVRTAMEGRVRWGNWGVGVVTVLTGAAMVAVFAVSGGLTGAEVAVAGGGVAATQWVLEKLLGAKNASWLVTESRRLLIGRVRGLLDVERRRAMGPVAEATVDPEVIEALRTALARISGEDVASAVATDGALRVLTDDGDAAAERDG